MERAQFNLKKDVGKEVASLRLRQGLIGRFCGLSCCASLAQPFQ